MEQLQAYWIKTKDGFWSLVSSVESSVLFERLVSRYEAWPTRQQKTFKALSTSFVVLMVLWFSVTPLVKTRMGFSENRSFFSLISSIKLFNSKLESARKEFIPPVGWQNISAADMNQLEESISVVMASLGVAEDQYEVAPQGNTLFIHVREGTVKQLESFMFQIDGLYPRYHVVRNKTSLHPANKELIQFEIEIAAGDASTDDIAPSTTFTEDEAFPFDPNDPFSDEALQGAGSGKTPGGGNSVPPSTDESDTSMPPTSGGVPGFEPPTFSPLDGDSDGDFAPSNRGDTSDFPQDDFIAPPPDESFDVVPIPDEGFPPPPPTE